MQIQAFKHRRDRSVLTALLLFAGATAAIAADFPDKPKLLPPDQAFRLSARVVDASTVEARFDVADGYYLYRDKLRFTMEPVAARSPTLPGGIRKHDEFFGDVETYRGTLVVQLPLTAAAAGQTLTLHADSQGCADAGVCYPPNPQSVKLVVPANGSGGSFVEPAKKGWFN